MQALNLLRDAGFQVQDLFICLLVFDENRTITPLEIMIELEGCAYSSVSKIDEHCVMVIF